MTSLPAFAPHYCCAACVLLQHLLTQKFRAHVLLRRRPCGSSSELHPSATTATTLIRWRRCQHRLQRRSGSHVQHVDMQVVSCHVRHYVLVVPCPSLTAHLVIRTCITLMCTAGQ